MSEQQIIVDRIENGFAICEIDSAFVTIPLSQVSGDTHEGDILYRVGNSNDERYAVATTQTDNRRDNLSKRFDKIKRSRN